MTHTTRYIDPNSGAAPQPGGYAGPEAGLKGHAIGDVQEAVEASPEEQAPLNELPESENTEEVQEITKEAHGEDLDADADPEQEEPEQEESDSPEQEEPEPEQQEGQFDPSEHDVDEVIAYVQANPDRLDAVLAAEKAGRDRKGIAKLGE